MIQILIVDDHRLFTDALKVMFQDEADIEVVHTVSTAQDAIQILGNAQIDIVLMDISLGNEEMDGMDAAEYIYEHYPEVQVIMLSMHRKGQYIHRMLKSNIAGYILKEDAGQELIRAIHKVYEGGSHYNTEVMESYMEFSRQHHTQDTIRLTPREKEVLQMIVAGFSTGEISDRLHIGEAGVETHRRNLRKKMDVPNTAAMVRDAILKGLVETERFSS